MSLLSLPSAFAQGTADTVDTIGTVAERVNIAYGTISKDRVVGAMDIIDGETLLKTSNFNSYQALKGQAAGLMGLNKVRGRSRGGDSDQALVIVDGISNRSLNSIALEEIASIEILKDATAKMLYGSKAANGVIVVTTKRGSDQKRKVSFSGEYGMKMPTARPEYLNSGDYTRLYNQAEVNDGKTGFTFSSDDIANYNDPSASRIKYPDVDYQDEFLKSHKNFTRFNTDLIGGNDKTKYFINFSYISETGMVAVGDEQKSQRFNIRSNLDYKVNDIISMNLDIASRFSYEDYPYASESDVYTAINSHRPNDYPLFVSQEANVDSLGYGNGRVDNNLYGELTRKGYKNQKDYYTQNSLGMNFDLNSYVEGLTASAQITFDASNLLTTGKELSYSRWQVQGNDSVPDVLVRQGVDDIKGTQKKFNDYFTRNTGGIGTVNYDTSFGAHDITADLVYVAQMLSTKTKQDGKSISQDDKSMNLGLRTNYRYDDTYVLEASTSLMGSDKFLAENRWGLYGALGAAWIMSNEDFMSSLSFIDHLKLKASYGVMGYDRGFDYYVYRDEYGGNGTSYDLGHNNSNRIFGTSVSRLGNPSFTFEESREINVGFESRMLDNRWMVEANYFNELRSGMPVKSPSYLPDYVIGDIGIPYSNTNAVSNQGVDMSASFSDVVGDLSYTIGANMIYAKSVYDTYDELYEYDHLRKEGKVTDALYGYVADGLYADQDAIDNSGMTSAFGQVLPGDIKYENITNDRNDDIIDAYDREQIGNTTPRISYALNIALQYKAFSFYALGQGTGAYDRILGTSYQNYASRKYTTDALGAANPNDLTTIANATHPRLTTLSGSSAHSYRTSTYWMRDASYFKLRTLELAYTLPTSISSRMRASNINVYFRANDILSFSKVKGSDPESPNSGISAVPLYSSMSLGLKLIF